MTHLPLALATSLFAAPALASVNPVFAQQRPRVDQGSAPEPAQPALEPPGLRRFEIKQMTPVEHEAFMQARAREVAEHPPQDVPPLPGQRIDPALRSQQ